MSSHAAPFTDASPSKAARKTTRAPARVRKAEAQPSTGPPAPSRRAVLGAAGVALTAGTVLQGGPLPLPAGATVVSPEWEQVQLPVDPGVVLLDIGFTGDDPNHGVLPRPPIAPSPPNRIFVFLGVSRSLEQEPHLIFLSSGYLRDVCSVSWVIASPNLVP